MLSIDEIQQFLANCPPEQAEIVLELCILAFQGL